MYKSRNDQHRVYREYIKFYAMFSIGFPSNTGSAYRGMTANLRSALRVCIIFVTIPTPMAKLGVRAYGSWLHMPYIPHEIAIGEVYFPPLLFASTLGVMGSWLTAMMLNRYRLSRFFYYPPLVFVALCVIYTGIIGTFFIQV